MTYEWDEDKRRHNIAKHYFDFLDAAWVLESPARVDIESMRGGQRERYHGWLRQ